MTSAQGYILDSVCHGTWTVSGIAMNRAAWATLNNFVLSQPAENKGENLPIPGRVGSIPFRRLKAETRRTMEMLVVGDCDETGTPNADRVAGLFDNLEYLQANVFDPVVSTAGTRTAVLTLPNGKTRTGLVQVEPPTFGAGISGVMTLTFDVVFPDGELGPPT